MASSPLLRSAALGAHALLLAFGGGGFAAAAAFAPGASPRLVAVYPPWWPQGRALAAAADVAPVAGVRGGGFVVGLVSADPGTPQALRRSGALFVADGAAFPACFSSPRTSP